MFSAKLIGLLTFSAMGLFYSGFLNEKKTKNKKK